MQSGFFFGKDYMVKKTIKFCTNLTTKFNFITWTTKSITLIHSQYQEDS